MPTCDCSDVHKGNHKRMEKTFYVYMLASSRYGTLYIGVTSNLIKRIWEHREGVVEGFTKEHGVKQLVWFETHADAISAITREKQLKKWQREWKIRLIQQDNPYWRDLFDDFTA
jgi:putative endonuclease